MSEIENIHIDTQYLKDVHNNETDEKLLEIYGFLLEKGIASMSKTQALEAFNFALAHLAEFNKTRKETSEKKAYPPLNDYNQIYRWKVGGKSIGIRVGESGGEIILIPTVCKPIRGTKAMNQQEVSEFFSSPDINQNH